MGSAASAAPYSCGARLSPAKSAECVCGRVVERNTADADWEWLSAEMFQL